jgi:serine/threonine protein kinase
MVLNEINILRQVDHPGIIKLHRVYEDAEKIYFVLDFIQGETLLNLIWTAKKLSE